jgi:hypothetical protein
MTSLLAGERTGISFPEVAEIQFILLLVNVNINTEEHDL